MPESGSTYCFSISAFLRTISQSMMTVSIVRMRLMRHHTILLECENEDEFQELEEEFAATHQPATPAEKTERGDGSWGGSSLGTGADFLRAGSWAEPRPLG